MQRSCHEPRQQGAVSDHTFVALGCTAVAKTSNALLAGWTSREVGQDAPGRAKSASSVSPTDTGFQACDARKKRSHDASEFRARSQGLFTAPSALLRFAQFPGALDPKMSIPAPLIVTIAGRLEQSFEMALGDTRQSTDSEAPRLSVGQWAQYQLDTSATIAEVVASDKVVRMSPEEEWQSQFLLWDRTGAVALLEWLEGKMVVITGDELSIPIFVNSTYESCIRNGDDPTGRFKKMSDRYAAYDPVNDSNGFEFVPAVLQEGIKMLMPPPRTLWQFIIDPRAQRMSFVGFDDSNVRYLELKDFDFSCQTPVEMFDLGRGDAGDVRSAFVPYTSSFNAELVEYIFGIYESYGIPTSDERIEKIKASPESTTCMTDAAGGSGGASGTVGASGAGVSSSDRAWGGSSSGGSSSTGGSHAQTSLGGGTSADNSEAGGLVGSSGAIGATGAGEDMRASGGSSGCACALGGSHRAQGLLMWLLCIGMVTRRRRRATAVVR